MSVELNRSPSPLDGIFTPKVAVAFGYTLTSIALTVLNTVVLRTMHVLPPDVLILAQQTLVLISLGLLHYFSVVVIKPIVIPSASFLFVTVCFLTYALLSMYAQRALELSLYVTLRKTQIVVTIFLEYVVLSKRQTSITVLSVCIILVGSLLIGVTEIRGNWIGYVYAFVCNLFGSSYIVGLAHHKRVDVRLDDVNMIFY